MQFRRRARGVRNSVGILSFFGKGALLESWCLDYTAGGNEVSRLASARGPFKRVGYTKLGMWKTLARRCGLGILPCIMRLIYFQPFSGASGDMILGALVDAGLPLQELQSGLSGLHLDGWRLECHKELRGPFRTTRLKVILEGEHHAHSHRGLKDILALIESSSLPGAVKDSSGTRRGTGPWDPRRGRSLPRSRRRGLHRGHHRQQKRLELRFEYF